MNREIVEIYGNTTVRGVKLKNTTHKTDMSDETNVLEDYKTDGVFLAIGHRPNTEFLKGVVELDEKGYVIIKTQNAELNDQIKLNSKLLAQTETSVKGIFAAGDCVDPRYRQAIVAAGQGCMAAMDAEKYLEEQK